LFDVILYTKSATAVKIALKHNTMKYQYACTWQKD